MCEQVSHGAVMTHKYMCILMWLSWFLTSVKVYSGVCWKICFLLHCSPCREAALLCTALQEFTSFLYILHYSIIIFRRSNNRHSNNLISWKPASQQREKKRRKNYSIIWVPCLGSHLLSPTYSSPQAFSHPLFSRFRPLFSQCKPLRLCLSDFPPLTGPTNQHVHPHTACNQTLQVRKAQCGQMTFCPTLSD